MNNECGKVGGRWGIEILGENPLICHFAHHKSRKN
jgi:hypothetical protein